MYPIELKSKFIDLKKNDYYKIIVITGNKKRHQRFAYRIQKEFPAQVVAWYELDQNIKSITNPKKKSKRHKNNKLKSNVNNISRVFYFLSSNSYKSLIKKMINKLYFIYYNYASKENTKIFDNELSRLKNKSTLSRKRIHPKDVNSKWFVNEIKNHDAYFLLTLGGPLYKKDIINSVNGYAINQHAGHSPNYKGSKTIYWALFHRKLEYVSSTVHLLDSGADSGPILRRTNVIINPNDTPEKIFNRSVALGTELMIEVVSEIMEKDKIRIFLQPKSVGHTYLSKDFIFENWLLLMRDFKHNWLQHSLAQRKK